MLPQLLDVGDGASDEEKAKGDDDELGDDLVPSGLEDIPSNAKSDGLDSGAESLIDGGESIDSYGDVEDEPGKDGHRLNPDVLDEALEEFLFGSDEEPPAPTHT